MLKKIIKLMVKFLAGILIVFPNKTKAGRYFIDQLFFNLLNTKKLVKHKNLTFKFYTPNRVNYFRAETFSTKEPETLEWIDRFNQDSVFWDIGANVGLYTCYAAKKANSKVYAFEPSTFNLEILSKNIFLNQVQNNVTIVPFPLTDDLKETDFNMSAISIVSGGSQSTFGENYKHDGSKMDKKFKYKMIGISIDQAVKNLGIQQPNYIKIDVDGIEHLILKGGRQTISNSKSVLVEIDENFKLQKEKSKEYLESYGFKCIEKKHSDLIKKSDFKSIYNQIWERF